MSDCTFNLEPLDKSDLTTLANLPSLNYTNQDFHSMKTRLVTFIQERFPNDFTDFVESSLAIMLIENWAFLADTLSFKMDQIVNELFIDTVTETENAFRLSKLVGFYPIPPIASRALFSATIQTPLATNLTIPGGIRLDITNSGEPLVYELFPADSNNNPIFDQDIVLPAGNLTNTSIVGLEGQTRTDTFSATGTTNQTYTLTVISVLYDSIVVEVDGQRWEKVDYFTDDKGRNEYRTEFDSSWTEYIIFGNGKAGRSPTTGSEILVTYRTGGGTRGNIITGFVNTQRGFDVPGFGFAVSVTFRNYTKGDFGYAGDGLEDIRRKLPAYVKTQDRAVTGEDYKTLADQFASPYNGQTGKAVAVLRNYGCAANIVDLYVLVKDGLNGLQEGSDDFKVELEEYMDERKMMTDFLCIRDGVIISVDIVLDVKADKFFRKFREEIERKIQTRVADFFLLNNWEYGKSLKENELLRALSDMKEVKEIDATFTTAGPDNSGNLVTAKYYEIIRNDVVTVNLVFE